MTEKKKNGSGGKTRREFLKDAGLLVGGTAIGSTVLLAACGGGEETTKTVTQTNTATVTATAPGATQTVTSTTTVGAGQTATETETATITDTQTTSRFICPIDGMEFDTLAELQAHFETAHPAGEGCPGVITLNINETVYMLKVEPDWSLAYVIREKIGLTGTKRGCRAGDCGVCTVIMNGLPILSCLALAIEADGSQITTIEGLAQDKDTLDPLQQAFIDHDGIQCGFCTPGMILTAKALLELIPNPSQNEIKEFMAGVLCRCGAYPGVIAAIESQA